MLEVMEELAFSAEDILAENDIEEIKAAAQAEVDAGTPIDQLADIHAEVLDDPAEAEHPEEDDYDDDETENDAYIDYELDEEEEEDEDETLDRIAGAHEEIPTTYTPHVTPPPAPPAPPAPAPQPVPFVGDPPAPQPPVVPAPMG